MKPAAPVTSAVFTSNALCDRSRPYGFIRSPRQAWRGLLQAFDLSYRFGGETRREERRTEKGFKRNEDELWDNSVAPEVPAEGHRP